MKVRIYTGLSISTEEGKKYFPHFDFFPPIKRLDIESCLKEHINVVGIIDGAFLQQLAVSPFEIMKGIRNGIRIYGASSMGAIRAAELYPYGMVGVGQIFNRIKNQGYFADDELGQIYFESEELSPSITLIDAIFCLEQLVKNKKISISQLELIMNNFKKRHFSERDLTVLYKIANEVKLGISSEIIQVLKRPRSRQKSKDAIQLCKLIEKELMHFNKNNK